MSADREIVATLVRDEGGGESFLADIGTMLQRLADRGAVTLDPSLSTGDSRVFRLAEGRSVPETLVRELGTHRAQLRRPGAPMGRIATARVVVTTVPVLATPVPDAALKTYNYLLRRVTTHATGAVASLDDVLAGRA
jgi:protein subunit release factor A